MEVFSYEAARISVRSALRGGYENLNDVEFALEARDWGDSVFYGDNGGRYYRIDGQGPYLGGNLNYVDQGMIFAAGQRTLDQAHSYVSMWNISGAGSLQYLNQRLEFTTYGYYLWNHRK